MPTAAQNSRSTIARLEKEAREKAKELSEIVSAVDVKKSELGSVEKTIFDKGAELKGIETRIDTKRGEINNLTIEAGDLKESNTKLEHQIVEKEATIVGQDYCIEQNTWTIQKSESRLSELSGEITREEASLEIAREATKTEEANVDAWVVKRDLLIKEANEAEARRDAALAAEHVANENAKKKNVLSTKLIPVNLKKTVE